MIGSDREGKDTHWLRKGSAGLGRQDFAADGIEIGLDKRGLAVMERTGQDRRDSLRHGLESQRSGRPGWDRTGEDASMARTECGRDRTGTAGEQWRATQGKATKRQGGVTG